MATSSTKNYYEILGVSKDANDQEIKKAYRTLSLQYHPDRNKEPDAQAKFQDISHAYEILSDSQTKSQYDAELNGTGGNPFQSMNFQHQGGGGGIPEQHMNDIFHMMFGGGMPGGMPGGIHMFPGNIQFSSSNADGFNHGGFPHHIFQAMHQQQKPPPIVKHIQLTMEQSYMGLSFPIEIDKWVLGSNNQKTMQQETVYITIPPGVDNNECITVQNKGNVVNESLVGDIRINISISNTSSFQRQGLDLLYKKKITLKEALCGFTFEFKHLNEKTLSLNNSTAISIIKPNYKKIIPQMGMKRDTTVGNLIIDFEIVFPDSLTPEQTAELKKIL
jgi:DnaJ family protein B protein 4